MTARKSQSHVVMQENDVVCDFVEALPQKLRAVVAEADFFALVSKYEGHPKSLIEALFYGLPVIVSDSPGVSSVVSTQIFHYFVMVMQKE